MSTITPPSKKLMRSGFNALYYVEDIAFTPDSRIAALRRSLHEIEFIDVETGESIATFASPNLKAMPFLTFSNHGSASRALAVKATVSSDSAKLTMALSWRSPSDLRAWR